VAQHFLNEERLFLKVHDGYHTVFISTDVENHLPGLSAEVCRGKGLL
jgi:hypothetical protein